MGGRCSLFTCLITWTRYERAKRVDRREILRLSRSSDSAEYLNLESKAEVEDNRLSLFSCRYCYWPRRQRRRTSFLSLENLTLNAVSSLKSHASDLISLLLFRDRSNPLANSDAHP